FGWWFGQWLGLRWWRDHWFRGWEKGLGRGGLRRHLGKRGDGSGRRSRGGKLENVNHLGILFATWQESEYEK
ncbi:MAG TPA: hypothetical protein DDY76_08705, partial [Opitutae bacterium]|nr:hypothetical protein [Opitutae bacterium]